MTFPVKVDSAWVNPLVVQLDGGELRRADSAGFAGVNGYQAAGVVRHADSSLLVTVDGSDTVTIQAGTVVIPGNAVAGTGVYRASLPAAVSNPLPTARDATNGRIDLVVFRQYDPDVVGAHPEYKAWVDVIPGTPSATPAASALPAMAVELARITVPRTGGAAAAVDSTYRTYATAIGAELVVHTTARLPTAAATGQRAYVLDVSRQVRWNGTVWVSATGGVRGNTETLTATSSGVVTITHGLGATPDWANVTGANDLTNYNCTISTRGATTLAVKVRRANDASVVTGAVTLSWSAGIN